MNQLTVTTHNTTAKETSIHLAKWNEIWNELKELV